MSQHLSKHLEKQGIEVVVSREPGGAIVGEQIREIIRGLDMDPVTETLLFLASRANHVDTVIKPALNENKVVILDRFSTSTFAIQGNGRGLDISKLKSLDEFARQGVDPDFVIFLDITPDIGLARKSGDEISRFELEDMEFHKRVYRSYSKQALENGYYRIDSSQPLDVVKEEIETAVDLYLSGRWTKTTYSAKG